MRSLTVMAAACLLMSMSAKAKPNTLGFSESIVIRAVTDFFEVENTGTPILTQIEFTDVPMAFPGEILCRVLQGPDFVGWNDLRESNRDLATDIVTNEVYVLAEGSRRANEPWLSQLQSISNNSFQLVSTRKLAGKNIQLFKGEIPRNRPKDIMVMTAVLCDQ